MKKWNTTATAVVLSTVVAVSGIAFASTATAQEPTPAPANPAYLEAAGGAVSAEPAAVQPQANDFTYSNAALGALVGYGVSKGLDAAGQLAYSALDANADLAFAESASAFQALGSTGYIGITSADRTVPAEAVLDAGR